MVNSQEEIQIWARNLVDELLVKFDIPPDHVPGNDHPFVLLMHEVDGQAHPVLPIQAQEKDFNYTPALFTPPRAAGANWELRIYLPDEREEFTGKILSSHIIFYSLDVQQDWEAAVGNAIIIFEKIFINKQEEAA